MHVRQVNRRRTMYQFSEKGKQALEQVSLPLVFFQNIDGQNVPLLVSNGVCDMLRLPVNR